MSSRRKACKIKNIQNAKLKYFLTSNVAIIVTFQSLFKKTKKSLSHDYTHGMNSRQFQPLKADGSFEIIHLLY